ncbi:MAG: hypothetical protein MUO78_06560 [candidate division Zixibacteria bacterium]|nr:hypothetical protein [candidate division Zixibacteria bacterium]
MRHTDRQLQQIAGLTNKQFRAKYKPKHTPNCGKKKTKQQRRQWWNSLSAEEKSAFIERKLNEKMEKRHLEMIQIMKEDNIKFDCKKCIHGLIESCTDCFVNGCTYYYDAKTGEHGSAYAA